MPKCKKAVFSGPVGQDGLSNRLGEGSSLRGFYFSTCSKTSRSDAGFLSLSMLPLSHVAPLLFPSVKLGIGDAWNSVPFPGRLGGRVDLFTSLFWSVQTSGLCIIQVLLVSEQGIKDSKIYTS